MSYFLRIIFIGKIFCLLSASGFSQNAKSFCEEIKTLTDLIREKHYQPQKLDSKFAVQAFQALMDNLDPDKLYFNRNDSLKLAEAQLFETGNLFNHDCSNLALVYDIYVQRLSEAIRHFGEVKFSSQINQIDLAEKSYALNVEEHLKHLQHQLLRSFYLKELLSLKGEADRNLKEPAFRKLVESEKCKAEKLLERVSSSGFRTAVLKAVASVFDPHTTYFTSDELAQFTHELSQKDYSFGIELKETNGEIRVSKVIPGSSAWKSNQVHEEDLVVAVADRNNNAFPMSCTALRDLSGILSSDSVHAITLTVEKRDGQKNRIKLLKEVVKVEDNVINSYLLNGRKKIGYISLPAFYGDESSENSTGCANDIAKEIVKLRRHNIEGLIFDLRFNPGGFLHEAIELAGLFIDAGPVCVVEDNHKVPALLKDLHRGAIYGGPMVVLVNNFSASASEVFAAAMQNYNRAVIVGERTYGKSTGQIFVPVADLTGWEAQKAGTAHKTNIVNLTTMKLFRIDGSTYQQKGVTPDILLPDILNMYIETEDSFLNAIDTMGTDKKTFYKKYTELPIIELKTKSGDRVSRSAAFKNIVELNITFSNEEVGSTENVLNYGRIKELYTQYTENIRKKSAAFLVENNYYNDQVLQINEEQRMISAEYADKINSDIYIEEAYFILNDLLELSNNK